jgi:hypothetical protein
MSSEQLISALKQIEVLVAECLKAAGSAPDKPASRRRSGSIDGAEKKTLSDHILGLRDEGIFSKMQTAREVHEKVQASYPCVLNRVEVELSRMVVRKQLRKASKVVNGKTQVAYVW